MSLKLENFSIYYDDLIIIKDINFEFKKNFINISGPNGAGKTIMIESLLGLKKFQGKIHFGVHEIKSLHDVTNNLLYIGHTSSISQYLTVKETLDLWASIYNSIILIPAAVFYWDLEDILDMRICELSKGTVKKVELAKLMACKSDFWVLDEPYSNLDTNSKGKLEHLIRIRLENGSYIISTSHDRLSNDGLVI